jgi:CheY-like chemotaxis protein
VASPDKINEMPSVLLIEDHPDIRENTVEMLELEGYKVISARNGVEGMALAKTNLPDLILCDIMMPEANGWEVISELKRHKTTSKIPFVFITASVEKKEMQAGIDLGAIGYIRKPFDHDELINTVKGALDKK